MTHQFDITEIKAIIEATRERMLSTAFNHNTIDTVCDEMIVQFELTACIKQEHSERKETP